MSQPDLALKAPFSRLWQAIPAEWQRPLALLGLVWVGNLALFFTDWRDMALQWWDSSTYNHVLLIPFILGWLISLRWQEVLRVSPQGWWPGLVLFAGAGFFWLLGDFAGLSLATQLGVVLMAQASVLTLLGPRSSVALLFPLAYMLFLVPAGDELIPALQTITARITMVLLGWTNVPAHIEGVFITTPGGYFEVAEACSGVKFLIAMIAYGALVANVCFRSWTRRAAFMGLSIAMPILANGVRAWGTIFIAEHRGIEFAAGFDHIFYGWIFFAVVMALVMAIAWRFFDRAIDDRMIDAEAVMADPLLARLAGSCIGQVRGLAIMSALALTFAGWGALANRMEAQVPAMIDLPAVPGWQQVDYEPLAPWQPLHTGADHVLLGRYQDAPGHIVDVSFALYAAQGEGREAGGFGQGALPMNSGWSWETSPADIAGGHADRIQTAGPVHRSAETYFRSGTLLTGSNTHLKVQNILDRLLLRKRATAMLILSSEDDVSGRPPADQSLRAFLAATGPVEAWMDRIATSR
ncbi:exosortase A [Novosphingobium sp. MMS21-SN21R]|uniref:exosortase A n=1 Tax=Novosphingobium sp. MMS21-SN21R TaxID=2969298 RepID=UPI002884DF10|nr:exosortase A [Novosphingobium sp. MMS21-SN21R]MDT0507751.1 exosortase A [Novosphingobium sp. MMS21-SN21R]